MSQLAWNEIDWKLIQKRLSRQQRRVYRASIDGNRKKVHALQRRIIRSLDAKLLAIKYIIADNKQDNNTSFGKTVSISDKKKMKLVNRLQLNGKTNSIKKDYNSRFRKSEYSTSLILIIEDRAKQMMAKFVLEPEWEANFKINSYVWESTRSCHDVIISLFLSLREKPQYILNLDLKGCFDDLDHVKLIKKLATFDQMQSQIKIWLKENIITNFLNEPYIIYQRIESPFQKQIIAPLLINIILHGLEDYIKELYRILNYQSNEKNSKVNKQCTKSTIGFSQYAYNFIISASNHNHILAIKKQVKLWLYEEIGLEILKAKINIVNSTVGFEFLAFHIISIREKKNRSL